MAASVPPAAGNLELDPVYVHTRREAIFILSLWVACFLYTVPYCYLNGYKRHVPHVDPAGPAVGSMVGGLESFDRQAETLTTPLGLGIPDWIFYGVVLPWVVCIAMTLWFCVFFNADDDLGADAAAAGAPLDA